MARVSVTSHWRHFLALTVLLIVIPTGLCQSEECNPPDRSGECIVISQCPALLSILQQAPRPVPMAIREQLKSLQCGFEGQVAKVCCPPAGLNPIPVTPPVRVPVTPPVTPGGSRTPPDVSNHRNLALLPQPNECGSLESDRVLGGNKTGIYEFPWMALISYNTRNGLMFKCGGTVINSRYILTAAHCISGLRNGQTLAGVRVGEHDVSTVEDCEGPLDDRDCAPAVQDFTIESIIPHPSYSLVRLQDDIGLLRLGAPIDLTKFNARPICLPINMEQREIQLDGSTAVVTGWGATETGVSSPDLLKVNLPIVTNERCGQIYNRSVAAGIGFRQLCAGGQGGVDSCGGDSGGPLKALGPVGGSQRYVQHGVVSFGPMRCGTRNQPGVYTRVAYYMDWILNQLRL